MANRLWFFVIRINHLSLKKIPKYFNNIYLNDLQLLKDLTEILEDMILKKTYNYGTINCKLI